MTIIYPVTFILVAYHCAAVGYPTYQSGSHQWDTTPTTWRGNLINLIQVVTNHMLVSSQLYPLITLTTLVNIGGVGVSDVAG